MEFSSLLWVHVFFGIVWAGGAIVAGLFIVPSVMDAGPAGGAVMAGMLKRRFPVLMSVSAILVILSGLLEMDVAGVVSAYRHQGLALAKRSSREGWATLVMKRGGAAARPRRLY